MNKQEQGGLSVSGFLFQNKVVLMFVVLCVGCLLVADTTLSYVLGEVATRFGRNTCLVLALIIPCLAGLGMNFGIVIGATAAQIAIFFVAHWGFTGIEGFMLCAALSTPLAILFGWLLGLLYNKTKGAEMIAGLVVGFFADGLYRLFVLYIIGGVIPFDDPNLLDRGFGLRNAFDLSKNEMKYALDDISFLRVLQIVLILLALTALIHGLFERKRGKHDTAKAGFMRMGLCVAGLVLSFGVGFFPELDRVLNSSRLFLYDAITIVSGIYLIYIAVTKILLKKLKKQPVNWKKEVSIMAVCAALFAVTYIPVVFDVMKNVRLAPAAFGSIVLFCIINKWILGTKLGMDMRTVGQNRAVATSAGINVNRIRIIATCVSTVLAAWGQLVFLQNLGTFNTVQQQSYVGLYAVAAILVGGASVQKATNKQAVVGVLLFHFLFVVAPLAATKLVGDSAISEYIRMFISYGIITVALAMHTWKPATKKKSAPAPIPAPAAGD